MVRFVERLDFARIVVKLLERRRPTGEEQAYLFAIFCLATEVVALFLTKSRAGIAVGVVAIAFGTKLLLDRRPARRRSPLILRAAVVVALFVLIFLGGRVMYRYDIQGIEDSRWCLYPGLWRMVLDHLPFGVGPGGFETYFPPYRDPECGTNAVWEKAHNGYLQGLATLGLAFPLLLLIMLSTAGRDLLAAARSARAEIRLAARMILAATAALAVHSVVDFPLEITGNAVVLAILAATVVGVHRGRRSDTVRPKHKPRDRRQLRRRTTIPVSA